MENEEKDRKVFQMVLNGEEIDKFYDVLDHFEKRYGEITASNFLKSLVLKAHSAMLIDKQNIIISTKSRNRLMRSDNE